MLLHSKIRQLWAEKTFDLTNLGAGALLFGQFISGKEFSMILAVAGLVMVIIGYSVSLILLQKK